MLKIPKGEHERALAIHPGLKFRKNATKQVGKATPPARKGKAMRAARGRVVAGAALLKQAGRMKAKVKRS